MNGDIPGKREGFSFLVRLGIGIVNAKYLSSIERESSFLALCHRSICG